ncbi:MAG TPA: hypothetical protein VHX38_12260 [Pseudonocardiaceae bacterium]|nr:hypothetical protein [Pseudonocardiaceae bacterium]
MQQLDNSPEETGEPAEARPAVRRPARTGRRSFRRPADYAVAVFIVVAVLVVSFVLWDRSDIHNTTLVTGPANVAIPAGPTVFPPSLGQVWEAPSTATPVPVVAGPTIATAADGSVVGRDPLTGQQRWRYTRDLGLCTVSETWGKVIAVYHKSTNCSEVTELDDTTGARGAQRNGDAQLGTQLVSDGTYVTTSGSTLMDTWRYDMVQTIEYGTVPDFVNPNVQPRAGCTYGSVAVAFGLIGVIERCPKDPSDRLTVYRATAASSDTPSVVMTNVIGGHASRLIAMTSQYAAVVQADPTRLSVYNDQSGNLVASYPLNLPASDLAGNPSGLVVPSWSDADGVYWYTGSSTIALSSTDFHPLWTVNGTLGAGTSFAGRYLVPVPNAIKVLDVASGAVIGTIGVNRNGYRGPVAMATLGPMVFEQRGSVLAALR